LNDSESPNIQCNQQKGITVTKFIVDLGKLHISDEKKSEISASIQQVVLGHLANIEGVSGDDSSRGGFGLIPFGDRPLWWGFILRESIEALDKEFQKLQKAGDQHKG
jgi:hypothetical protein